MEKVEQLSHLGYIWPAGEYDYETWNPEPDVLHHRPNAGETPSPQFGPLVPWQKAKQ